VTGQFFKGPFLRIKVEIARS